jgi:hypothetical protein
VHQEFPVRIQLAAHAETLHHIVGLDLMNQQALEILIDQLPISTTSKSFSIGTTTAKPVFRSFSTLPAKGLLRLNRFVDPLRHDNLLTPYDLTRSSAVRKFSALLRKPSRSSAERSGGKTSVTPPRPTTLGKESVTPNSRFAELLVRITDISRTLLDFRFGRLGDITSASQKIRVGILVQAAKL